jgi:hypothetical protein
MVQPRAPQSKTVNQRFMPHTAFVLAIVARQLAKRPETSFPGPDTVNQTRIPVLREEAYGSAV